MGLPTEKEVTEGYQWWERNTAWDIFGTRIDTACTFRAVEFFVGLQLVNQSAFVQPSGPVERVHTLGVDIIESEAVHREANVVYKQIVCGSS